MIEMKKIILAMLVIAALSEGCKKYEEGPLVSLRSAEKRLFGTYALTQYSVNGEDSLILFNDSLYNILIFFHDEYSNTDGYKIEGKRNDNKTISLGAHWEFNDNKTKIKVIYSECKAWYGNTACESGTGPFFNHATPEWYIIRLTHKEVKMKTNYNGKEYKIELKGS